MSVPSSRASQAPTVLLPYIDSVLSQKGLPYHNSAKATIRSHLSSLLQAYSCLHLKTETFSLSDGRPLLLHVGGTIPVLFLQVFYNIPIVVWLCEQYPFRAPLVFVTPSPFMIIKAAHPFVDLSGLVSYTHLYKWSYPAATLVDLVHSLCVAFGLDPPVYSINYRPSPSPSSSLLGPGSIFQRWPSHSRSMAPQIHPSLSEKRSLAYQDLSQGQAVSKADQPPSATSLISAGSFPCHPSAQQHPIHVYDATMSTTQVLSSSSTTPSLLGPGNISQWHSIAVGGASQMSHSQTPLQSSGLSKRPSLSPQAAFLSHDGSMALCKSSSPSLLGPGKLDLLHTARNSSNSLFLPSPKSPIGPCLSMLRHFSDSTSLLSSPSTSSSSVSLLRTGAQRCSYAPAGVPPVGSQPLSESTGSAVLAARTQVQQHLVEHPAKGEDVSLSAALSRISWCMGSQPPSSRASNSCSVLPMSESVDSVSNSSQLHGILPLELSNPLVGIRDQPLADRRQVFLDMLVGRLEGDIDEIRTTKEDDMLKLMDMEDLLKHRQAICNKAILELQHQKENLEVQLQNVLINTDILETWLMTNGNKSEGIVDIDDVFEPCDVLSYQLLECTALDLAYEDALYCLDRAAQDGILCVDAYLRLVRTHSTEQFFHRALAVKVRAAQQQC